MGEKAKRNKKKKITCSASIGVKVWNRVRVGVYSQDARLERV